MNTEIFGYELPEALTKEELYGLFFQMKNNNMEARKTIIEHNVRLVVYVINIHFGSLNYEKEDLVSIGLIGLIKAVDTYNLEKRIEFSTYAVRCIENEIYTMLKNSKKSINTVVSLNETFICNNGNKVFLEDVLFDEFDMVEWYNQFETCETINKLIDYLTEREKEIVKLYFGFYEGVTHTEQEIANKLGVTKSYISAVLIRAINKLRMFLQREEKVKLVRSK